MAASCPFALGEQIIKSALTEFKGKAPTDLNWQKQASAEWF